MKIKSVLNYEEKFCLAQTLIKDQFKFHNDIMFDRLGWGNNLAEFNNSKKHLARECQLFYRYCGELSKRIILSQTIDEIYDMLIDENPFEFDHWYGPFHLYEEKEEFFKLILKVVKECKE